MNANKLRIMIAKPGLDVHDRGAKAVTRFLQDAGYPVVYMGGLHTHEEIVEYAIREKIDLLGLSCLSGAHRHLFPEVIKLLENRGAGHIWVVAGGTVPERDFPYLYDQGIKAIFPSGTSLSSITDWIDREVLKQFVSWY